MGALLDEAKGANCDGVLSVQFTPGPAPDRVGIAQFTLLDVKRIISAAAIDDEALAAEKNERNALPKAGAETVAPLVTTALPQTPRGTAA